MKYILSIDQGTSSCRAIIFGEDFSLLATAQKEITQYFPNQAWVEHDPEEIWETQLEVIREAVKKAKLELTDIDSIGITNQRETTVVWDHKSQKAIHPAIVWQDKRTSETVEELMKVKGLNDYIRTNTGLIIDAYFSGTKIKWILDHVEGARAAAEKGDLRFGTIDTWLMYKLTEGKVFKTDYTNASRTMIFNIKNLAWDDYLLYLLNIPKNILPTVQASRSEFGMAVIDGVEIPIQGVVGDQQSALFGQCCFKPGESKNTYGTGCFMLMNTGNKQVVSHRGLLTTLTATADGKPGYALEGSIFIAGAAIQWLRDGLKLFAQASDSEQLAMNSKNDEVVVVPAFTGLGAPYWDMFARGSIFGLTRDVNREDLTAATLRAIAFQTKDVLNAMQDDSGIELKTLKVDGGASANNLLMQFQSDILDTDVERPQNIESTAQGAAFLAGLQASIWTIEQLKNHRKIDRVFSSQMSKEHRSRMYNRWLDAIESTRRMGSLKGE